MSKEENKMEISGLKKEVEDFMLEQCEYYYDLDVTFWTSFWKKCVDIWSEGRDLSEQQLKIIYSEYEKKKERKEGRWVLIKSYEYICPLCHQIFRKIGKARSHKAVHTNIEQNPITNHFCCLEHKLEWIYQIQNNKGIK